MIRHSFSLKPFPYNTNLSDYHIDGLMSLHDRMLAIEYNLRGILQPLEFPEKTVMPRRKDQLWENTCFEFFIAIKDAPQYWEFNLSPSGDWNVYAFQDYRRGMKEETFFTSLPFASNHNFAKEFQLILEVDMEGLISKSEQPLEFAISTVMKHKRNGFSYWALTHPGSKPDFHLRDSFAITM